MNKVKCIKTRTLLNELNEDLGVCFTKGKCYEVIDFDDDWYTIIDDNNEEHEVDKEFFIDYFEGDIEVTKHDELRMASRPLVNFLNENYDPMTIAIVREGRVDIFRGEIGIPLRVRD